MSSATTHCHCHPSPIFSTTTHCHCHPLPTPTDITHCHCQSSCILSVAGSAQSQAPPRPKSIQQLSMAAALSQKACGVRLVPGSAGHGGQLAVINPMTEEKAFLPIDTLLKWQGEWGFI
eukprot:10888109-Lingulodinium_polyedra.AAC.1